MYSLFDISSVYNSLLVLIALLALFVVVYFSLLDPLRKVPGPIWSHFNNVFPMWLCSGGNMSTKLEKLHQRYGPLVRIGARQVHFNDAAALPTVYGLGEKYLKTDFYDIFSMSYNDRSIDSVMSLRSPEPHRRYLKQTAEVISRANMTLYEASYDETFTEFCKLTANRSGEAIDINAWLPCWAFDVNCNMLFGRKYGFMDANGDVKGVLAALNGGSKAIGTIGHIPALVRLLNSRIVYEITTRLTGDTSYRMEVMHMVEELTDLADKEPNGKYCMYKTLRKALEADDQSTDHAEMIGYCADLFVAGAATTVTIYQSIMYQLAKNQDALKRLTAEVREAAAGLSDDEHISFSNATQLPYLQGVVQEGLRMAPAANVPLPRSVPRGGAYICGCYLPEGTSIGSHAAIMNFNAKTFGPQTRSFRPERWTDADPKTFNEMKQNMLTFGKGDYACKGQKRAVAELCKFTYEMVRRFEIKWARSEDEECKVASYWSRHLEGAMLNFVPRENIL